MLLPEGLLVVVACTLSGGIERDPEPPIPGNASCGRGTEWAECGVLDEGVLPEHIVIPWAVTLGTLVFLSMPTLLLRSKHKERALGVVAWNFLQCLGLMVASSFATDHPSIRFVLGMHSCALLLGHLELHRHLVGPSWWWGLRYLSILGLLAWEVALGPAVSVVRWPSTPGGPALPCAYLAHLGGVLVPAWVLCGMRALLWVGRCMLMSDG
jgi:hypothetical protein